MAKKISESTGVPHGAYVSQTDPALVADNNVMAGKIWIEMAQYCQYGMENDSVRGSGLGHDYGVNCRPV